MSHRNPGIIRRVHTSNRVIHPSSQTKEIFEKTTITKTHSISKSNFQSPPSNRIRRKQIRMSHQAPTNSYRVLERNPTSYSNAHLLSSRMNHDSSLEAIQRRAYERQSIRSGKRPVGKEIIN